MRVHVLLYVDLLCMQAVFVVSLALLMLSSVGRNVLKC